MPGYELLAKMQKENYEKYLKEGNIEAARKAIGKCIEFLKYREREVRGSQKQLIASMIVQCEADHARLGGAQEPTTSAPPGHAAPSRSDTGDSDPIKAEDEFLLDPSQLSNVLEDIQGSNELKDIFIEMKRIYIDNARRAVEWDIKAPKGILLYGPPGTGKTFFVKCFAGEVKDTINAIFVRASDIDSKYFGESAKVVNEVFEIARRNAPAIIFIDEIDSIVAGKHEETKKIKVAFQEALDGFLSKGGFDPEQFILLVSATNNPWDLPPAFADRFERRYVGLPDENVRKMILERAFKKQMDNLSHIDFVALAKATDGYNARTIDDYCDQIKKKLVMDTEPSQELFMTLWEAFRKTKTNYKALDMERQYREWSDKVTGSLTKNKEMDTVIYEQKGNYFILLPPELASELEVTGGGKVKTSLSGTDVLTVWFSSRDKGGNDGNQGTV